MRKNDLEAVKLMYNALMAIGCIDSIYFENIQKALHRSREIAMNSMQEIHVKHTKLLQDALGIGKD